LTTAPRIKPTSIFLRSARRPNPGRGSTYRRGIAVQTTGTSSAGATHCINYRTDPVANAVLAATQGAGVDRVIEVDVTANAQSNLKAVVEGGTWVVYGSSEQEFKLPFIPLTGC
jgi:NADPH:quinone reductase-like Zn-dependent oxidoreductase